MCIRDRADISFTVYDERVARRPARGGVKADNAVVLRCRVYASLCRAVTPSAVVS